MFWMVKVSKPQMLCLMPWTLNVGSITSGCLGKGPALLPRRQGWMHKDSFVNLSHSVNHPQIFVGCKLSRQLGLQSGMVDNVELINGMWKNFRDNQDQKFENSWQENWSMAKMCSFFSQQGWENFNLLQLPEPQITSQQRLNIGLKRPNSQSNRLITFFKESDSGLWGS